MAKRNDSTDRITERRTIRRKRQKRAWMIRGAVAAVLLYLVISIVFSLYSGVTTTIALKGTVEEEVLADGYVFREQTLINAPASGYLECRVSEGDRVNEGQLIGYVYTGQYDAERSQKIQELSDKIARFENSVASENTYADNSVMVEQKIAAAARDLSDLRSSHDMNLAAEGKEELNLLIEKKHAMESGGDVDFASELEDLKQQLQELENSTGGAKMELRAQTPGVFSSRIDGMEDKLSMEAAETVTPSYLESLDQIALQRKETVTQGEPVCKIVNNYGWYFGANIDADQAQNLKVGQGVRLRFFDLSDTSVYGTVRALSQEERGKVAVSIYTNRYVNGIYASSRASAEIVTTSAEGIKLPAQALHVQNDQTGVFVLRLDVARFVPVDVKYKNGEWAIVSPVTNTGSEYKLQIYDEVIVEAKNLEDGKVVR